MKNKFIEQLFFIEITNSCKFNCPGCNIDKTKKKRQLISEEDLKYLNKSLLKYYNKLKEKNENVLLTIILGPGDYFSMFAKEEIEKHIKIFDKKFRIVLSGNYSLKDEEEKIQYLKKIKKEGYKFEILIVYNPLIENKNEEILKENIINLKKMISPLTNVVINFSNEIFNLDPQFIIEKYKKLDFSILFINFNPNLYLLKRKEKHFKVDLVKETEWYIKFYNLCKKEKIDIRNINYFETLMSLLKSEKNVLEEKKYIFYEFFINKHLNIYLVKDNMGEFIYNKLNEKDKIGNLKEEENLLEKIDKKNTAKKIIYREIINKNKYCKNCEYSEICINLSVFSQIENLKKLGFPIFINKKGNKYCKGYKKLIDIVKKDLNEKY